MSRPRLVLLSAALLVLILALTPLIPRGEDDGGLRPTGRTGQEWTLSTSPSGGQVTAQMRGEIDRVVAETRRVGTARGKQAGGRLADALTRCADFDGQRYCLGLGWTDSTQSQVRARMRAAARTTRTAAGETTGDLDAYDVLRRTAALSPNARARADRAELTRAARSVAKVWVLRHEIQGVPLPESFLEDHPEARAGGAAPEPQADFTAPPCNCSPTATPTPSATATPGKSIADYPAKAVVLDPAETAEQTRTYWCGPTSMQMIAWGWEHVDRGQDYWAGKLGTTTDGSSIFYMVRVNLADTGWDDTTHAGK